MRIIQHLFATLAVVGLLASCSNETQTETDEAGQLAEAIPSAQAVSNDQPKVTESTTSAAALAAINFEEDTHDFGTIKQGEVVKHVFKFTNTGDSPLLISDIKTSCGCTTPEYTKDPVAPGADGEITVQFNSSGKRGIQNKNITIYANTETGASSLLIKCNILEDKELAGPFKQ